MKSSRIAQLLICILTIGWIVPFWLSIYMYLQFVQVEEWPLLAGKHSMNSFPYLAFSSQCFTVACIWLAVVVFVWSWFFYTFLFRKSV